MSNQPPEPPKPPKNQNPYGDLRSPLRPVHPDEDKAPQPEETPAETPSPTAATPKPPQDPQSAVDQLRHKMEMVARQYAAGKINRAQFNAIYGRYNEQRVIIERLVERNPENTTWQHVAAQDGHTSFLLSHFEARALYYITYRLDMSTPLMMGGTQQPDIEKHIEPVLRALQESTTLPKNGLARKTLENGRWLVLAMGRYAVTMVLFMLEPSKAQLQRVRDLHMDFERANHHALDRRTNSLHRMVFPQRALVE
jgi:hypothetical protein